VEEEVVVVVMQAVPEQPDKVTQVELVQLE
jgi:hypothetical protein